MKKTGALILTVIWGMLMVQPVFGSFTNGAIKPSCLKKKTTERAPKTACKKSQPKKPSCSKPQKLVSACSMTTSCSKPKKDEEKKDCEEKGCNPLMSCPAGNFFLFSQTQIAFNSLIPAKTKTRLVNDNRLSKQLTECFHPPEII